MCWSRLFRRCTCDPFIKYRVLQGAYESQAEEQFSQISLRSNGECDCGVRIGVVELPPRIAVDGSELDGISDNVDLLRRTPCRRSDQQKGQKYNSFDILFKANGN